MKSCSKYDQRAKHIIRFCVVEQYAQTTMDICRPIVDIYIYSARDGSILAQT